HSRSRSRALCWSSAGRLPPGRNDPGRVRISLSRRGELGSSPETFSGAPPYYRRTQQRSRPKCDGHFARPPTRGVFGPGFGFFETRDGGRGTEDVYVLPLPPPPSRVPQEAFQSFLKRPRTDPE